MAPPLNGVKCSYFLSFALRKQNRSRKPAANMAPKVHSRGNNSWPRMKAFRSLRERPIRRAWKMESSPNSPVAMRDRDKVSSVLIDYFALDSNLFFLVHIQYPMQDPSILRIISSTSVERPIKNCRNSMKHESVRENTNTFLK